MNGKLADMEISPTENANLALTIALAAIIVGPLVAYIVGRMQERGAAARFKAEQEWHLAKEIRLETASFLGRAQLSGEKIWVLQQTFPYRNESKFDQSASLNREVDKISARLGGLTETLFAISLLVDSKMDPNQELVKTLERFIRKLAGNSMADINSDPIFDTIMDQQEFMASLRAITDQV